MTRIEKTQQNQKARFSQLAQPILAHPEVQRMRGFVQHGNISTYAHCVRVAQTSFRWARALHLPINESDLVAGALLHDFYLYDWHERAAARTHHATRHPLYASENARRLFDISPRCRDIIESHMWPLPPNRIPRHRESWIVCAADKWCSLQETLFMRGGRGRQRSRRGERPNA